MSTEAFVAYASVITDVSIDKLLDYGIKEHQLGQLSRGVRVEIPIRGRPSTGYIHSIKTTCDYPKVLPIGKILSENAMITPELFELALWISKYYCAPLQTVLQIMVPSSVRKDTKHKEQLFVMRAKTREILAEHCKKIRDSHPAQADVLDAMLMVTKGMLLTELMEEADVSRSPIDTLAKQGFLQVDIVRIDRSPLIAEEYFITKPKKLNSQQQEAFDSINKTIEEEKFQTFLLHGITGSGKTEIYLQAIEKALAKGKGTLMLVPEISLTAQTIERFRSRFEGHIAILHHRLSQGERFDEWHKIHKGDAKIVIGARSAVFSPIKNLGLIIVDEEHEQSYKQGESCPCYHARDVAVMRGKITESTVILGTATPSIESYYNATTGKYKLCKLSVRAQNSVLPKVTIVDMNKEFEKAKGFTTFSEALLSGIIKRQEVGEQSILFLNRRGYHTTLFCKGCNKPIQCKHCDVALTFHLGDNTLACHLCGFHISPPPRQCPSCKSTDTMKFRGIGTELVEKSLHAIMPGVRTLRIDADTTRHKGSHHRLLKDFGTGKADVLIGTQMIAKGLHFPEVTLVGVLNSDTSLNIPDFRAAETSFQQITQVAGRAGRGCLPGEVIIQTCMPENQTIAHAARQDYEAFYAEEIEVRKLFGYPPFGSLVKIAFSGKDQGMTKRVAEKLRHNLAQQLPESCQIHAVVPSGHHKVKDFYHYQMLIKTTSIYSVCEAWQRIKASMDIPKAVQTFIDVNPLSTFF
jgi:primosomal protein N' (replication factor Y)